MVHRIKVLVMLATFGLTPAVRGADSVDAPLTVAERAYVAAQLHAAIHVYFAHWEATPDLDLDAAFRAYLDEALAATDRRGFDLATHAFVAQLRNGHSYFADTRPGGDAGLPIGFRARPLGREWVVTSSTISALRPGDVLSALDGEPIERFYERNRRYLSASSEREARLSLFWARILFPVRFTVTVRGGRDVNVDRTAIGSSAAAVAKVHGRWLADGRVAYVRVPGFGDPAFEEEALRLIDGFRDAPALVIDVRGNGGGDTPLRLIRRLMNRPWRSWAWSTPMTVAVAKAYGELLKSMPVPEPAAAELRGVASFASPQLYWVSDVTPPVPGAHSGRIVLLVDAQCASACEDFVVPFKDNGRATIIGEPTGGSSGQPFVRTFPNGMTFHVGARRVRMPDGSPFEGIGIVPDVIVEPTAKDMRTGEDPALDAAVRLVVAAAKRS